MTTLSEKKTFGDVVRYSMRDDYTIDQVTVHNRTGSTVSTADVMGYPLRPDSGVTGDYMLAVATGESYVTGLLIDHRSFAVSTLANAATFISKALVRGPAIVDKVNIPTLDVAGVAFTLATIVTALAAVSPPILCKGEPTVTVTQTN